MVKKITAVYCIFIGLCMIGVWSLLLTTGAVVEIKTELIRISFHLLSEYSTAVFLIMSGIGIIAQKRWANKILPICLGALLYSVLTSAGFYGQKGNPGMIIMFSVIFVCTVIFTYLWMKSELTLKQTEEKKH